MNWLGKEPGKPTAQDFADLVKAIEAIPDPVAGKPQSTMPAYDRKWFEEQAKKKQRNA